MWTYVSLLVFVVKILETCGNRSPNANFIEQLVNDSHYRWRALRYSDNIVEDALLDAPGLVRKYGYPIEVHHVVTADGYILEAHRIPHGRDANNQPGPRPVVFIMHGLLCSSADFLVLGPGRALGYILAEAGYDVWLGNARGNFYSRRHLSLDPNDRVSLNFWKFSWDEIGNYDLPALVDYILATTKQSKMHYIGYSQGGTAFLVLNSLRREYNDKFITFQGLTPRAQNEYSGNDFRNFMIQFENIIEARAYELGFAEVLGANELFTWLGLQHCSEGSKLQQLCVAAVVAGTGVDLRHFNVTMLPIFIGHNPAGAALRQIIHFGQVLRFKRFARYNHNNPLHNLAVYGSFVPPEYDLSQVTVPAYLHYSIGDRQNNYKDILLIAEKLPNTAGVYKIERSTFTHFDYIWGTDAKEVLYDKLIEIMQASETFYI